MKYLIMGVILLQAVSLSAHPNCWTKANSSPSVGYDTKLYRSIECRCECAVQRGAKNRCITCGHIQVPSGNINQITTTSYLKNRY